MKCVLYNCNCIRERFQDEALSKSCHCQNWLSISEPLNTVAVAGGILKFELNAGSIDVVVIFSPDDMLLK